MALKCGRVMMSLKVREFVKGCVRSGAFSLSGDELSTECPSCGDDTKRFSLNLSKSVYNCFKCGIRGKLPGNEIATMPQLRGSFQPVGGTVQKTAPVGLPFCPTYLSALMDPSAVDQKGKATEGHSSALSVDGLGRRAIRYAVNRGLSWDQIVQYRLFVKPYSNRVYFPYWNADGVIIFWMGRLFTESNEPKTMEYGDKSKPLYGRHVKRWRDWVILTEGVFDHFKTPRSYSIMGSIPTIDQIKLLRGDGITRVALLLDPDAEEKMYDAAEHLNKNGVKAMPVRLTGDLDPGGMEKESVIRICQKIGQCLEVARPRYPVLTVYC